MKKIIFIITVMLFTAAARGDMALYINAGVSNLNPTIGLDAEFQFGYVSAAIGGGVMSSNNFGWGTGLRGYLFGIDGGPYLEALYGVSGEKIYTHEDGDGVVYVDKVDIFRGISLLAGWRFFFADGWNMTVGAGAAEAAGKGHFIFNFTAGVMVFGDEAAQKNAEKYRKSYEPPEPEGVTTTADLMPEPGDDVEFDAPLPEMTGSPEAVTPAAETATPVPAAVTTTPAVK